MDEHMFEAYTKQVEIETTNGQKVKLTLRPLSGRFLPKLYSVLSRIDMVETPDDETPEQARARSSKIIKDLGEEGIANLHLLCLETLKKSYKDMKEESVLDEFVSQNLLQIFPALLEVNLNSGKKE